MSTRRPKGAPRALTAFAVFGLWSLGAVGCGGDPNEPSVAVPGVAGAEKTAALVRAERRLFDGAPPVIPHENFGAACVSCHDQEGMAVEGVGFSPPSPHAETVGLSAISNCRQCHVFQEAAESWRGNAFAGLRQDLRRGRRLHDLAPPVLPHGVFMRENCVACHSGPAAREAIRTDHPERANCLQCHVEQTATGRFEPDGVS
ncbi:MAG: multiheme c-type cytochrome [Acidobacteriota bacterium]